MLPMAKWGHTSPWWRARWADIKCDAQSPGAIAQFIDECNTSRFFNSHAEHEGCEQLSTQTQVKDSFLITSSQGKKGERRVRG